MVSSRPLHKSPAMQPREKVEYQCRANLNLYDSPKCDTLATQAAAGRHLRIVPLDPQRRERAGIEAIPVRLCEDDYPGWLKPEDGQYLEKVATPYRAIARSREEIERHLAAILAFTEGAKATPNYYLWGGTLAPNYDCSGLMQAAFMNGGQIWLPRDAYQQEAFTEAIALKDLQPGDLVFFGERDKATHVGLYLGDGRYIHSSGKEGGRNGIGIDVLSAKGDRVSRFYFAQLRGAGRVMASYLPKKSGDRPARTQNPSPGTP
ncbi:C40 family peptidase [Oxynema sp. CENA135]|jgi:hypothetical protein|nr:MULTISPECIES: C40 family peptidase [Oxynema]MBK4729867.1 C40 family peptidase [Oxynema sp. CENA135]